MKSKRGRHTSAERDICACVDWLERLPIVQRVLLGVKRIVRHHRTIGYMRVVRIEQRGIALVIYTGLGIRNLFVVCSNKDLLVELIKERYPEVKR